MSRKLLQLASAGSSVIWDFYDCASWRNWRCHDAHHMGYQLQPPPWSPVTHKKPWFSFLPLPWVHSKVIFKMTSIEKKSYNAVHSGWSNRDHWFYDQLTTTVPIETGTATNHHNKPLNATAHNTYKKDRHLLGVNALALPPNVKSFWSNGYQLRRWVSYLILPLIERNSHPSDLLTERTKK